MFVVPQAAFNVGILMTVMGILNLGSLIHFISHPVMSGIIKYQTLSLSNINDNLSLTIILPSLNLSTTMKSHPHEIMYHQGSLLVLRCPSVYPSLTTRLASPPKITWRLMLLPNKDNPTTNTITK